VIDVLAALAGSVTVLVSSHDPADVKRICERIGVLAKGRLVYQGAVSELLAMAAPAMARRRSVAGRTGEASRWAGVWRETVLGPGRATHPDRPCVKPGRGGADAMIAVRIAQVEPWPDAGSECPAMRCRRVLPGTAIRP